MDISDIAGDYPPTEKFDCGGVHPCSDITMNLPNTTTRFDGLAYEQGSDGGLYLSTASGVYFTDNKRIAAFATGDPEDPDDPDDMDNTSGWVRLGDALPHVVTRGLEINYVINRIRVGTIGRGVWEHHLHCPDVPDYDETGQYGEGAFLEALHNIHSIAVVPTEVKVTYRAGNEVHLGPGFHAVQGSHFHAFIHPCDLPGNSLHPKNMLLQLETPDLPSDANGRTTFLVFPNPANGTFTVQAEFLSEKEASSIRLYGPTGNLVLSASMGGPLQTFTVPDLHGLYMVVIESRGDQMVQKLMLR